MLIRPPRGLDPAGLAILLRCLGGRVKQSSQSHAAVSPAEVDPVVLSDNLIADPRMLRDLHSQRLAHQVTVCTGSIPLSRTTSDQLRQALMLSTTARSKP